MDITELWLALRKRWRVVLAAPIVAIFLGALVTWQTTPQYSASARLFVSTRPTDTSDAYQGSLLASQQVASFADLITTDGLRQRVASAYDGPLPDTEQVTAEVVPDTVIIEVTATDANPVRARDLAQAYAESLATLIGDIGNPTGRDTSPIQATLVDSAQLPLEPTSPRPIRNVALACLIGLVLGVGLALLREVTDTSLSTQEDVGAITEAPVVGHIVDSPHATTNPHRVLREANPWAESFRVLRTNMQYLQVDSDRKAIVVTSPTQGDGKSTCALGLAITLAYANHRVLLVDCDLRRPSIAHRLNLDATVGTTSALIGQISLSDAFQQYAAAELDVMTSGPVPPNPSELLQSHAMLNLIAELRELYDIVILDAPPVLPVTDATILAALADGALVVIRHGQTTSEQLEQTLRRLAAVDAKTLGIVMNVCPVKPSSGVTYGYGYSSESQGSSTGSHRRVPRARRRTA